ncbi:MAG: hypothetical protein ACFFEA_07620 [Candidatus Thorarchaeota archaeon]
MDSTYKANDDLPVLGGLAFVYLLSLLIAGLIVVLSVAGILYPTAIYPTTELLEGFLPNDVVNLLIGVPILLGSMWLTNRRNLVGVLFWPGALFYEFYTYLVYVLGMQLNFAFLGYLTVVMLSGYTLIGLVAQIDQEAVHQRLSGRVPEKASGGVLAGLGLLFLVLTTSAMIGAIINQTPVGDVDLALRITDFLLTPTWIIGGALLWRRRAFGYITALGLLFQASMLFIGLIAILIIQPLIAAVPFALLDVLVVAVMGLICFIPLTLFIRGASLNRTSTSPQVR